MKSNKPARKHSSPLINQLLAETSEAERLQVSTKMMLAARLDDLIIARGWNKSEFAGIVGKSPSEITKWLSGTQNFTIDTLSEIAVAFNMPVGELLAPRPSQVVYKVKMVIILERPAQSEPYMTTITRRKDSSTDLRTTISIPSLSLSSRNLAQS